MFKTLKNLFIRVFCKIVCFCNLLDTLTATSYIFIPPCVLCANRKCYSSYAVARRVKMRFSRPAAAALFDFPAPKRITDNAHTPRKSCMHQWQVFASVIHTGLLLELANTNHCHRKQFLSVSTKLIYKTINYTCCPNLLPALLETILVL